MTEKASLLPQRTELTEPFWDGASDGELRLQRCENCDEWIFYPRPLCPHCFSTNMRWERASGDGTIYTYTIVRDGAIPAYKDDVPYPLAVVNLVEGPRMMANVLGCDPDDVTIGMDVHVTFEDRDGRALPQFEPAVKS
jgi:uncharacterized OB-fold protein